MPDTEYDVQHDAALTQAVEESLPYKPQTKSQTKGWPDFWRAVFEHESGDGRKLFIAANGDKWVAFCSTLGVNTATINVSRKRGPQALVTDIQRKLLPEFDVKVAEEAVRLQQHELEDELANQFVQHVAKLVGKDPGRYAKDNGGQVAGATHGDVYVSDGLCRKVQISGHSATVSVVTHGLSIEQFEKLQAFLRELESDD